MQLQHEMRMRSKSFLMKIKVNSLHENVLRCDNEYQVMSGTDEKREHAHKFSLTKDHNKKSQKQKS